MDALRKIYAAFREDPVTCFVVLFVGLLLVGGARTLVTELTADRSITPGRDFPLRWAERAGLSQQEADAFRAIELSIYNAQREKFEQWLRSRGKGEADLDAIAPRLPVD